MRSHAWLLGEVALVCCVTHLVQIFISGEEKGFPGGSAGKEFACNVGDLGSIPGLRRSPGEGNGYPLWYSCLGNSVDREAWQTVVHGVGQD